jgi:hypothetical protein
MTGNFLAGSEALRGPRDAFSGNKTGRLHKPKCRRNPGSAIAREALPSPPLAKRAGKRIKGIINAILKK